MADFGSLLTAKAEVAGAFYSTVPHYGLRDNLKKGYGTPTWTGSEFAVPEGANAACCTLLTADTFFTDNILRSTSRELYKKKTNNADVRFPPLKPAVAQYDIATLFVAAAFDLVRAWEDFFQNHNGVKLTSPKANAAARGLMLQVYVMASKMVKAPLTLVTMRNAFFQALVTLHLNYLADTESWSFGHGAGTTLTTARFLKLWNLMDVAFAHRGMGHGFQHRQFKLKTEDTFKDDNSADAWKKWHSTFDNALPFGPVDDVIIYLILSYSRQVCRSSVLELYRSLKSLSLSYISDPK